MTEAAGRPGAASGRGGPPAWRRGPGPQPACHSGCARCGGSWSVLFPSPSCPSVCTERLKHTCDNALTNGDVSALTGTSAGTGLLKGSHSPKPRPPEAQKRKERGYPDPLPVQARCPPLALQHPREHPAGQPCGGRRQSRGASSTCSLCPQCSRDSFPRPPPHRQRGARPPQPWAGRPASAQAEAEGAPAASAGGGPCGSGLHRHGREGAAPAAGKQAGRGELSPRQCPRSLCPGTCWSQRGYTSTPSWQQPCLSAVSWGRTRAAVLLPFPLLLRTKRPQQPGRKEPTLGAGGGQDRRLCQESLKQQT